MTTRSYVRWLYADAQRVLHQAARELATTERDPESVLEKRRLLLLSSAYANCAHMKKGGHY